MDTFLGDTYPVPRAQMGTGRKVRHWSLGKDMECLIQVGESM